VGEVLDFAVEKKSLKPQFETNAGPPLAAARGITGTSSRPLTP
jgi:hypothetical protein